MLRLRAVVLAAMLVLAPLGARAADLVVWWDEGYYAAEHEAVREIIAAFEQKTGKQVELVFHPEGEHPEAIAAALEAGQPPDFAFGFRVDARRAEWAFNGWLADLTDALGPFSDLFDPDALASTRLLNQTTGQKALYALPMGRTTNHVHVWKSLLEQAGFTVEDIPREWEAFWSFWCDRVQPVVRQALGRDDIWGVGLPMSANAEDARQQLEQFMIAYDADWVTHDGRLVIDRPEVRQRLVDALDSYTAFYRKGCTPPDTITWANVDNNKQFHAQRVLMTLNHTLSIVNSLQARAARGLLREYRHSRMAARPRRPGFSHYRLVLRCRGFCGNIGTATEFVRFLVSEGWLAHYLNFSSERLLPAMPKLLDAPFWLDPSDRHRMAAAMQVDSRPTQYDYARVTGNWRYDQVSRELVWGKAIHRVAAEGSPEQAVDEAIARIKQILAE